MWNLLERRSACGLRQRVEKQALVQPLRSARVVLSRKGEDYREKTGRPDCG
ncbi:hypothetical protein ACFQO7_31950 [Catellatospora aurea]|uniref:Uncharacterized protein n=1 Tax=Catellatospora aurea TaxID=1337874 RepID=A0ABW2H5B6_9ACTN